MIRVTERMNPFPGLRPFEFGEEHLFFGREERTDELLARLHQHHFVAVVGPSGSGKSSLLNAGLLPALYSGFLPGTGSQWRLAYVQPGSSPIHSLAAALARSLPLQVRAGQRNSPDPLAGETRTTVTHPYIEQLVTQQSQDPSAEGKLLALTTGIESTLRRGRLGLLEVIRQTQLPSHESTLVVVDGLESWIHVDAWETSGIRPSTPPADTPSHHSASSSSGTGTPFNQEDEVAAFIKLLLAAVQQRQQPIYVAIALRSDFVGDCARFVGLPEVINLSQYLMPRMTRDQRRAAIEGPIGVVGGAIAPQLVQHMLSDMGDSQEPLPAMQHALMRTWDYWLGHHETNEPVSLRHYKAVGGIAVALSKHADRIYAQLTQQQQAIARRMFQLLTQRRADGREMRRAATLQDIARVAQVSQEEVRGVVNRFRGRHNSFLLPPQPQPLLSNTVLTISHESLMRAWPRLAEWMIQEGDSAREYSRLADTASRYWLGEAKLLPDPELTLALRWQQQQHPNSAWAERYGNRFGDTVHFLERSRKARDREAELQASAAAEQTRLHQRHLKQTVGAAAGMATLAGVAILGIVLTGFRISAIGRAHQQATHAEIDARISASKSFQEAGQELAGTVEALTAGRQLQESNGIPEPYLAMRVAAHLRETVDGRDGVSLFDTQSGALFGASFSPDGQSLVSAGEDATIKVWSLEGNALSTLHGRGELSSRVSFHPDGSAIAAASADGTIDIWTLQGEVLATFQGHEGRVRDVSFSPDGDALASAGDDGTVRVWDLDGESLVTLRGHDGTVRDLTFSPNGNTIASAGDDATVRIWNLEGEELGVLRGHKARVNQVSASADGRTLASASDDGTVKVWTLDGEAIASLQGHDGTVNGVEFAPDGQTLASTGADGTVLLWNAQDGRSISTLQGHTGPVFSASFSPDGQTLASAGEDGTLRVWNFQLEDLLTRGCQQIAGDLQALSGTDLGNQAVCNSEAIATARSEETVAESSVAASDPDSTQTQTSSSLTGNSTSSNDTATTGDEVSRPESSDRPENTLTGTDRASSENGSTNRELPASGEAISAEDMPDDPDSVADRVDADSADADGANNDVSDATPNEQQPLPSESAPPEIAAVEPTPQTAPQPAPQPSTPRGRVTWPDGLILLSTPAGVNVGGIGFNEVVAILESSSDGRWQRVRRESSGQEGWVKSGNLAVLSNEVGAEADSAEVTQEADSDSSTAAPAGDRGRVTWPSGLAIRPVPQDGVGQIDGIPFNEMVTILESSEDGRWQRVRRDTTGTEGWVKAGNIAALTTSPNSPTAAPAPAPSASYQGRVTWRQGLAIRVEPRDGAAQIEGVPFSEVVTILSTSSDGRWQRVRRDVTGTVGWVKAGNIALIR
ncbi:MAG: SH3 domain-containing protein [Cyanobacteria bacterium J06597_1]